jgi:hypothetical protein
VAATEEQTPEAWASGACPVSRPSSCVKEPTGALEAALCLEVCTEHGAESIDNRAEVRSQAEIN